MKDIAKYTTIGILIIAFCVGCVGSFLPIFLMENYTSFLKSFAPIYMIMITSIGANSAIKKIQENKKEIK